MNFRVNRSSTRSPRARAASNSSRLRKGTTKRSHTYTANWSPDRRPLACGPETPKHAGHPRRGLVSMSPCHPDVQEASPLSQPTLSSRSKSCGSGGRTAKSLNGTSPQLRSGGGGGMQTVGYDGLHARGGGGATVTLAVDTRTVIDGQPPSTSRIATERVLARGWPRPMGTGDPVCQRLWERLTWDERAAMQLDARTGRLFVLCRSGYWECELLRRVRGT